MRPRIRTIKPEIASDEELWDLGVKTGLPVFQAFVMLWCQADREGRFEWRPRALKVACLPFWEGDFSRVLDALVTGGFIVEYEVLGRKFGLVRTFTRHQAINGKEPPSQLPEPPVVSEISRVSHVSKTGAEHVEDVPIRSVPFPSVPDPFPKGGVGGGEPKPPSDPKEFFRLPRDWDPGPEVFVGTMVPEWAHPELLGRFRAYHCNGNERRDATNWRQSYAKHACGEWRKNPPAKPETSQRDPKRAAEVEARMLAAMKRDRDRMFAEAGIDINAPPLGDLAALTEGVGR